MFLEILILNLFLLQELLRKTVYFHNLTHNSLRKSLLENKIILRIYVWAISTLWLKSSFKPLQPYLADRTFCCQSKKPLFLFRKGFITVFVNIFLLGLYENEILSHIRVVTCYRGKSSIICPTSKI